MFNYFKTDSLYFFLIVRIFLTKLIATSYPIQL